MSGLDVGVALSLQVRQFRHPAGYYIRFIGVIEITCEIHFLALQSIGANLKRNTLVFQTGNFRLHLIVRIAVIHFGIFQHVGRHQQCEAISMQHNLEVKVVLTDSVDMVLNVSQSTGLLFRGVIVNVIDDFLLGIGIGKHRCSGSNQYQAEDSRQEQFR